MIKGICDHHPVYEDFQGRGGEYDTPTVAFASFDAALMAHGYHLEKHEWSGRGYNYDSIILDIYDGKGNLVGLAHIAWSMVVGHFSVIGKII